MYVAIIRRVMGLQEGIKQTERQLNLLRECNIEKERAIITLMNLQMAGITEKQIVQLAELATKGPLMHPQQNGHSNNGYISEAARKPKSEQYYIRA